MASPRCDTVPVKPFPKLKPVRLPFLHQKSLETRSSQRLANQSLATAIGCRPDKIIAEVNPHANSLNV